MKRFLILVLILSFSVTLLAREPLTFEQRVKAQEAIEKVYYSHRIWPKENKSPKPAFEKMVSKETIEANVTDYLKKSAALEKYWHRPITGEQLQAEMNRMAKGTKDPATLNELFEALNNDPYLIAECLARPVLADRLIRNWYANDERFHKETREKAEEALKHLTPENFCSYPEGQYSKMTYRLEVEGRDEMDILDPEDHSIGLSENEFAKIFREVPEEGKISGIKEKDDCFVILNTIEKNEVEMKLECLYFTKTEMDKNLKNVDWRTAADCAEETERYLLPLTSVYGCPPYWDNGILDEAPSARRQHTAVWTGSEMIVIGGSYWVGFDVYSEDMGIYDPSTDSWQKWLPHSYIFLRPRIKHTAVWTGSAMIVWGGECTNYTEDVTNTGGVYDISTRTWSAVSTGTNVPTPRCSHSAVWTGTEMIVWGGYDGTTYFNTGGRYSPLSDSWTNITTTGAPEGRNKHFGIWTGTEMIVWGGHATYGYMNYGARYNPITDIWNSTSTLGDCPMPREGCSAVWTGTEMIIWGGYRGTYQNTGSKYDPLTDTWKAISAEGSCPEGRFYHTAVWTGSLMIVWGGYYEIDTTYYCLNSGGIYDPASDTWRSTSQESNVPCGRFDHTAIWDGSEMIVWGGAIGVFSEVNSGARYSPFTDTWVPMYTRDNVPTARSCHSAIWTGTEMIIWGGINFHDEPQLPVIGGRYNPVTDSWTVTQLNDAPVARRYHSAVWTGSEMIVWGGYDELNSLLNTGGRYNPYNDSWLPTSTAENVPAARVNHTAVWTGTNMIIWGGAGDDLVGGRYSPATDEWTPTSIGTNCPSPRGGHVAVWTGNEMIIWGGYYWGDTPVLGGRYNPVTDTWLPTSTGSNVPGGRENACAVWTGSEMIVWGGGRRYYSGTSLNTGGRYNPVTDSWSATSTGANVPIPRTSPAGIWTGKHMIIWGGTATSGSWDYYYNSGALYDPVGDAWSTMTTSGSYLEGRVDHTAVWTGNCMIIWGGEGNIYHQTGGIFYPYPLTPVPLIDGSSVNACPWMTVNLSVPPIYSTYLWKLNGIGIYGAVSPAYEVVISGDYTVTATDLTGCTQTSPTHTVTILPCVPEIVFHSNGSFSEIIGDGDANFEKGEKWSVPVTVTNSSGVPATSVTCQLSGNGITVCNATGMFGTMAAEGTATYTFSFVIDDDFTPCGGSVVFSLTNKACSEATPAGGNEAAIFSVSVGQGEIGIPTDLVIQPPIADSYVNQAFLGSNYGTLGVLYSQAKTSQARRTLVRFDVSSVPANSTINSATLELKYTDNSGLPTINLHVITSAWTESGVTWMSQPTFNATPYEPLQLGGGWKKWDVAFAVQDWVNGTIANNGFLIKCQSETGTSYTGYTFASKEHATASYYPILRINYTPPDTLNCDYVSSGECDAVLAECAPGNTYENGQMWSGTSQSWPVLSGATGYKLYRGVQSGLQYLLTAENDSCLRYQGSSTSIDLSSDDPSGETGRLYWYIVTGTNGSGEGPAGNGRIVNSSGNCE